MRMIFAWAALCASTLAHSQEFPSRPVHLVVPFTAGTGADILARALAPRLSERWKVAVVTENKAGATGNIGADFVAKSTPDGHTLLFVATSFGTVPALMRLPFDPVKSFTPVALVATSSFVVAVNAQLPVRPLKDLMEAARREPGSTSRAPQARDRHESRARALQRGRRRARRRGRRPRAGHHRRGADGTAARRLRQAARDRGDERGAFDGLPGRADPARAGLPGPRGGDLVRGVRPCNHALTEATDLLSRQGMAPAGGPPERLGELLKRELARWRRVVDAAGIKAD